MSFFTACDKNSEETKITNSENTETNDKHQNTENMNTENNEVEKMFSSICELTGLEKEILETTDTQKKQELEDEYESLMKKNQAFDTEMDNKYQNDKKKLIKIRIETLEKLIKSCGNASDDRKMKWEDGIKNLNNDLKQYN